MKLKAAKKSFNKKTDDMQVENDKEQLFGGAMQRQQEDQNLLGKQFYINEAKKKLYNASDITLNIGQELDRNNGVMTQTLKNVN